MSDWQQGPGWWLASDGKWYPPTQPPGPAPTPTIQPFEYAPQYAAMPQTTNGFAIASLVLGLLCLYGIGSILALVFGYKARREIADSRGRQKGRGLATAGIVLGWIGIVGAALLFIVLIAASGSSSTDY